MVMWLIFALALTMGLLSSYTTRVWARSDFGEFYSKPLWRTALGALGFPAIIALFVWGFMSLPWYVVVILFLLISLFVVPSAITTRTVGKAFVLQPIMDVTYIVLTLGLWISYLL